jgi:hypothetical protein
MTKRIHRVFQVGETLYVIDWYKSLNGCSVAMAGAASVLSVNEEAETFRAVVCGTKQLTYSFDDYNRVIFDKYEDAFRAASSLPRPRNTVYLKTLTGVSRRTVKGIIGRDHVCGMELYVVLDHKKEIPIKEIGKTLFRDELSALF